MRCAPRKVFIGSWSDVPLSVSDLSTAVLFPVPSFLDAELRHRDDSQGKNLTKLTSKPGQRLIIVLGRIEKNSFFLCLPYICWLLSTDRSYANNMGELTKFCVSRRKFYIQR
jgi:hypothetical protein